MHEGRWGMQCNPPSTERQAACGKGLSAECPAKLSDWPIGGLGWSQRRGSYLPLLPKEYTPPKPPWVGYKLNLVNQTRSLWTPAKRREGVSNYRTSFVPSSVKSRALNLAENVPYKVSSMFTLTSLRSQQVAIITAGRLLGIHTSHSSNLKAR